MSTRAAIASRRRLRRRWIVLAALAAVAGIIALAGGFRPGGHLEEFQPGDSVDLGPMTVAVHEARAMKGFDELWVVRVYGECQMTEPGSMSFVERTDWLFAAASDTPRPRWWDNRCA